MKYSLLARKDVRKPLRNFTPLTKARECIATNSQTFLCKVPYKYKFSLNYNLKIYVLYNIHINAYHITRTDYKAFNFVISNALVKSKLADVFRSMYFLGFSNQACVSRRPVHAWFLIITFVRKSMLACVCMCVHPQSHK